MPVLKDFRQTKVIVLEKYEGSEVEIYDSALAGDLMANEAQEDPTNMKAMLLYIKGWNFTNEAGEAMPLDPESLKLIDGDSLTYLANAINEYSTLKKKEPSES